MITQHPAATGCGQCIVAVLQQSQGYLHAPAATHCNRQPACCTVLRTPQRRRSPQCSIHMAQGTEQQPAAQLYHSRAGQPCSHQCSTCRCIVQHGAARCTTLTAAASVLCSAVRLSALYCSGTVAVPHSAALSGQSCERGAAQNSCLLSSQHCAAWCSTEQWFTEQ